MPRPHWKTASPIVQRTVKAWLNETADEKGQTILPAEAWRNAASVAKSLGFDSDPPALPKRAELEKLVAAGDVASAADFRKYNSLALAAESNALAFWESTRGWAATNPAAAAKAQADGQKRAAAELELRVQARAQELLAMANHLPPSQSDFFGSIPAPGQRHILSLSDAIDQARKELGHVST